MTAFCMTVSLLSAFLRQCEEIYRIDVGWAAPTSVKPIRTLGSSNAMVDGVVATLQTKTMLRATVDFDKPGKQTGFIQVPHSVHDDAWGVIPVPIAVISNGSGPDGHSRRRQSRRRVRGADRARRAYSHARSRSRVGTSHFHSRHQPAGSRRRAPHVTRSTTSTSIAPFPATRLALRRNRSSPTSTTFCFRWRTPFSICIREVRRSRSFPAPSSSRSPIRSGMRATRPRRSLSARR